VLDHPGETESLSRKRLLIVSTTHTAKDVRIMRHINFLADHFDIETIGYGDSPPNVQRHIKIPDDVKYLPISLKALLPHILRMFGLSSQRIQAIQFLKRTVETTRSDIVLLNDVQTLPLLEHLQCPTVVDMHEYAPLEMEDDWRFRLFLQRYYTWLCEKYLPLANAVTTVSNGLASEYQKVFGVECTVVLNARDYRDLKVHEHKSSPMRLVHSGLAAKARRLEVMMNSVANLSGFVLDMYLVSAPRQSRTLRKLKRLADQTNNIRILDPVPSDTLPEVLNSYDLSLPYIAPANFSLEHCMPNKLFDSIQARIGIVSGPSPDMADFCKNHKIGFSTKRFSSAELRGLLISLNATEVNSLKRASDVCAILVTAEAEAKKLHEILHKMA
jgi:hypothetical protein